MEQPFPIVLSHVPNVFAVATRIRQGFRGNQLPKSRDVICGGKEQQRLEHAGLARVVLARDQVYALQLREVQFFELLKILNLERLEHEGIFQFSSFFTTRNSSPRSSVSF